MDSWAREEDLKTSPDGSLQAIPHLSPGANYKSHCPSDAKCVVGRQCRGMGMFGDEENSVHQGRS